MTAPPLPDPDCELLDAARLLDVSRERWKGHRAEAYLRSSARVRATRDRGPGPPRMDEGLERGFAARVERVASGAVGFAAASGANEDLARWAFEVATRGPGHPAATISGGREPEHLIDHDEDLTLPSAEELAQWLSSVQRRLDEAVSPPAEPPRVEWVESGTTVESLVTDQGLRASRARRRVWAMAVIRRHNLPGAPVRPRFLADSRLGALDPSIWENDALRDGATGALGPRPAPGPLVIEPEAAAAVVVFLVQALHGPTGAIATPVGRGWRLADEPEAPGALFGGSFDDAGFPTRRVEMADGHRVSATLDGRGHYRRPSFRDPPEAMAANLVLEASSAELPRDGYFVHDARVVPLDAERCVLRLDGVRRHGGVPAEFFIGASVPTSPRHLARCVAAAVGPLVRTAAGVVTPHLVLEGLKLEV